MLQDSKNCLQEAFDNYAALDLTGSLVRIEGKIKAFTFGYAINPEIFCVLYEVADLAVKGLSQFIFREFAQQLANYKYINIMDDSGLGNLKKVKLSYHPLRLIPAYTVSRK